MTRAIFLSSILIFFAKGSLIGQDYPAADQKWMNHHTLMHTNKASGRLSDKEAARIRKEYRQVRKMEKQMTVQSKLTTRETKKIYLRKEQIDREVHSRRSKKNMFSHCFKQA
jgi:hypothetical protein